MQLLPFVTLCVVAALPPQIGGLSPIGDENNAQVQHLRTYLDGVSVEFTINSTQPTCPLKRPSHVPVACC